MLNKKHIIILAFIIVTIICYQFAITRPYTPGSLTNTSGTSFGNNNLDISELLRLQKDLKAQQNEIRKQLESLKFSVDNAEINGGAMCELDNNEERPRKQKSPIPKPTFESDPDLLYQMQLDERLKKTYKDQPNTCIPSDGKLLCLPNFIVIGTMKSGTTFLDFYLQKHPQIAHHNKKEIWYFNSYYANGIKWYADHFEQYNSLENQKLIGEATPFYINNPNTAPRMYATLKNAKLILLLRDPVERALSQYHFSLQWLKRNKQPALQYSFEHLIAEEADVIETCVRGHERYREAFAERKLAEERGEVDPDSTFDLIDPYYQYHSEKNWTFYKDCVKCDKCFQNGILHTSGHPTFGMLAKSLYYEQIDFWLDYFPLSQIHIIRYEDISHYPEKVLSEVEDYLGITHNDYGEFKPKNVVPHDKMGEETRSFLVDYFRESNKKLYKLLNRDFNWQSE
ncbi:hypothetical protein DICPUDRAFT_76787 [Dictyostelium purpureum]|uniref:Sulfotransferase domain-containing protein n=1 Tax=Dictyostelium purpureum TaxID=5786 RepID=F0ZEM5_DICPU|nr:uncharacterized protein DICPUDRAFT_76787 [Dictyostelium purpureum]EGC37597.1 hypothetical protein DICPUDRAFT_76787 [Dictyostelium purpureum]|eukprot:XP_003285858.1 hypothetical protein DICPUDRAFT_76787 [Dictyostelium purpureum]